MELKNFATIGETNAGGNRLEASPQGGAFFVSILKSQTIGLERRTGCRNPSVNEVVIEERPGATISLERMLPEISVIESLVPHKAHPYCGVDVWQSLFCYSQDSGCFFDDQSSPHPNL